MTRNEPSRIEPIEEYLDELLRELRLPPAETRRLLAETEGHLREAAETLQAGGLGREHAEQEAVRRFGTVGDVTAAASAARRPALPTVARSLAWSSLTLTGAGLLAVGLSGGVAALANALAGPHFVGALPETYPAAACAYFTSAHPGAANCAQAAMWENSQDAVTLRVLAGLLGVLALVLAGWWRRRLSLDRWLLAACDGATAAIAALAFGVAALVLVGMSIDLGVQHGSGGVGYYLSGGLVASAAATLAATSCYRRLRAGRFWPLSIDRLGAGA